MLKKFVGMIYMLLFASTAMAGYAPHYHYGEYRFTFDTYYTKVSEFNGHPAITYNVYNTMTSFSISSIPTQYSFPQVSYDVSNRYFYDESTINVSQSFEPEFLIYACNGRESKRLPFSSNEVLTFDLRRGLDLTYCSKIKSVNCSDCSRGCSYSFYGNIGYEMKNVMNIRPIAVELYCYNEDDKLMSKSDTDKKQTVILPFNDDLVVEMTCNYPDYVYRFQYALSFLNDSNRFESFHDIQSVRNYDFFHNNIFFLSGEDMFTESEYRQLIQEGRKIVVCNNFENAVRNDITLSFEPRLSAPGIDVEIVNPKCYGDKGYIDVTLSREPGLNDELKILIHKKGHEIGMNPEVFPITTKKLKIYMETCSSDTVLLAGNWKRPDGKWEPYYADASRHRAVFSILAAPPAVEITNVGKSDVKCHGGKDGSISFSVENAQNGYTATLQNIDGSYSDTQENTIQFAGLDVGKYTLTVTDGNGCNASKSVTKEITQNEPLDFSVSGVDATQYGKPDGVLNFNHVTGGCAPYSVNWRSDDAEVEGDVIIPYPFSSSYVVNNSLQSGHYTVEVMDHNGCTSSSEVDIHQPIALNIDKRNVTCYGYSDGMISVSLDGGEPPYSVTFSSNDDSENYKVENHTLKLQDLRAGDYNVTAIDIANRTSSTDVSLSQHGNIEVSIPDEITVCKGQTVRVGVDKPAPENIYKWYRDDEYLTNGDSIDVTDGGLYSVIASDGLCSDTSTMQVIKSPKEVSCDWIVASTVKKNGLVRLANITRENFTSYQWHYPQDAGIEIVEEGDRYLDMRFSVEGKYMLGMSSYHDGCKETVYKKVEVVDAPFIAGDYDDEGLSIKRFSVSPNPSDGNVSVSLELSKASDAEIRICDFVKGVQVAETLNLAGSDKYFERMSLSLTAGMYIMVLMLPENSIRQTFKLIIK